MTRAGQRVLIRAREARGVEASLDNLAAHLAPEGRIVLLDDSTAGELAALLDRPTMVAVDVGCVRPVLGLEHCRAPLVLRLATATVLGCDVAGPFAKAVADRHAGLAGREADLRLALQEAVGNAVMHGNLEVGSALRAVGDDLMAYVARMTERAADPVHAGRSVTMTAQWDEVAVILSVEDEGPGFDPLALPTTVDATAVSGRGLGQIRSVCRRLTHERGGRRITMRFELG